MHSFLAVTSGTLYLAALVVSPRGQRECQPVQQSRARRETGYACRPANIGSVCPQGDYSAAFHHYSTAYGIDPSNKLVVENMEKLRKRILKSFKHSTTIDAAFEMS